MKNLAAAIKYRVRPKVLNRLSRFSSYTFLDIGKPSDVIIVAGMARSGTTWVADLINYDNSYRVLFEPFLAAKVNKAKGFEYLQYLDPNSVDGNLCRQAQLILGGNVRGDWVDRDHSRLFYRRRIIKDVRINLMLGWLKKVSNGAPIVLTLRHPLQVAASWSKLGYGKEVGGDRTDFDILLSQDQLLSDFPIITHVKRTIDPNDFVETLVFEWCVLHVVPFHQLTNRECYVVFYENLMTDPHGEIEGLFGYLEKPFEKTRILEALGKSSNTNFLKRNFEQDRPDLLRGWQQTFSSEQIQKTNDILSAFGLAGIYDKKGLPTRTQVFR